MPPPDQAPVRVLIGEQEVLVDGMDALRDMAREGRIDARTRVSLPGERAWQPAGAIPEIASLVRRDPWSAWASMDDDKAKDALERFSERTDEVPMASAEDAVDAPTLDSSAAPAAPAPNVSVVEELPLAAVMPIERPRTPMVVETPSRRSGPSAPVSGATPAPGGPGAAGGQVIAFPGGSSGRGQAVAALASRPSQAPPPIAAPPVPSPAPSVATGVAPRESATVADVGTRWWRVATVGGVITAVMLLVQWYITITATTVFPPREASGYPASGGPDTLAPDAPPREVRASTPPSGPARAGLGTSQGGVAAAPAPAGPAPATPAPVTPALATLPDSPYIEMETELRVRMLDAPRDVETKGQLEDALLIELRKLQVVTTDITAPVLTWAGRKRDVPQSAEIHIRYTSRPNELDRELAAIGLVIGRYVHTYALDVPILDVIIEGLDDRPRQIVLDPAVARRFYMKRIDLATYLRELRSR